MRTLFILFAAASLYGSTVAPSQPTVELDDSVHYPPFDPTFDYPGLSSGETPFVGWYGCWECIPETNVSPFHPIYQVPPVLPPIAPPRVPVAATPEPAWGALALAGALAFAVWRKARRAG